MKKIIGISLLSLIILVFGILPWAMGLLAQRAMVEAMNASAPANSPVSYQLVSYQRHWFTSDVVYTVTSKSLAISANQAAVSGQPNASATVPTGITVTEKVYHGPIVFTRNLDQSLRVYVGQAVAKGIITSNPAGTSFQTFFPNAKVTAAGSFQELTTLGLTGRLCLHVGIPALTMTSNNGASVLKTSPIGLYVSTNHSLQKFSFGVKLQSISVLTQGKPTFTLNNWDMRVSMRKSPEQLLLGEMSVKIADMTATVMSGRHVDLQGFNLAAQSDVKRKLLDSDSQLTFTRLTINDKQFGPGIAKLSFKRFDPKAQAELAKLNSYATPQTPWAQAAMVQEAGRLISKLIAHGAQVSVNPVNVKTADGDINLSLLIKFPNVKGKSRSLPLQLHNTDATFELALPKVLAHRIIDATNRQQIQLQVGAGIAPNGGTNIDAMVTTERTNQVNNWLSRGYMVSSGDNYTVKLSYKQGTAYVNGKALKDLFAGSGAATTTVQAAGMPAASAVLNAATAPTTTSSAAATPTAQTPAATNASSTVSSSTAPAKTLPSASAPVAPTPSSAVPAATVPAKAGATSSTSVTPATTPTTNHAAMTSPTTTLAPIGVNNQATPATALTSVPADIHGQLTPKLVTAPVAAINQAAQPSGSTMTVNNSQPTVSTSVMRSAGVTVLTTATPTVSLSVETGH